MTDTRQKFRIRGETRLKNARLVQAREESGLNQLEFSKLMGISYGLYNAYENMREYPSSRHAQLLASHCDCIVEELFPAELKKYAEGEEPRHLIQVAEIEPSRLLGSVRREALLAPAASTPDTDLSREEAQDELNKALSKIRPKDAQVVRLYFGLDGEDPLTLEEIGSCMGFTRGNVRRLRDRALRELSIGRTGRKLVAIWREDVPGSDPNVAHAAKLLRQGELDLEWYRQKVRTNTSSAPQG